MNAHGPLGRLLSVLEHRPARLAIEVLLAEMRNPPPSTTASLLFLHGPSGSGKTHLVEWLADTVADSSSTATVLPAESSFKSERSTGGTPAVVVEDEPDWLIVEDLQFLSPSDVEPFLSRLDQRQVYGLPTVVTASAGPRHLRFRGEPFPARLTSRLAAGLVVAVPLPQAASRRAFLEQHLRAAELYVPETVVDHLANQSRGLRSLQGAVHQLALLARIEKGPLKAAPLLEHFQQQTNADKTSVDRIVQSVAGHFRVAAKDVRSRSRRRGFVMPRHVSMYLARKLTPLSYQQIGAYFGGCDHATVLHACRKMEHTLDRDPELGGAVRQLHDDLA
jgi:chromosomal replication initiator protein